MSKLYNLFRYYNGESENPFDVETQNNGHNFWEYERLFEEKFNKGDFSNENWIPPQTEDHKEWEEVLSINPVNKEELFKLWLSYLLVERLPEKHQSDKYHFLNIYYK